MQQKVAPPLLLDQQLGLHFYVDGCLESHFLAEDCFYISFDDVLSSDISRTASRVSSNI
ncbi:hypothetical protein Scep_025408 [Stephania cephalantha]|uniref:Uncharacterized protein n=1 Tax=Stephania cephalantha TaxID=152367 RepID=A0AAP0ES41_9MAGN